MTHPQFPFLALPDSTPAFRADHLGRCSQVVLKNHPNGRWVDVLATCGKDTFYVTTCSRKEV